MKFSLRFLLFIAPCILVAAYFVIWHVQGYFDSKREDKSLPIWDYPVENISILKKCFEDAKVNIKEINLKELNLWLSDDSSSSMPPEYLLRGKTQTCWSKRDSWGNPLIAVVLDENNHPTHDALKANSVGFYSNGQDGITNSHGCDLDDLASWRIQEGITYYDHDKENSYWQSRKFRAMETLLMGTASFLLLWLIGVVGYRMLFKKA